MLFKILGIERGWQVSHNDFEEFMNRPRQMFLTQSMVLANRVREAYTKMHETLTGVQRDTHDPSSSIGSTLHGLVDHDEEAQRSGRYPKRYSDLGPDHFPFFGTIDQVH